MPDDPLFELYAITDRWVDIQHMADQPTFEEVQFAKHINDIINSGNFTNPNQGWCDDFRRRVLDRRMFVALILHQSHPQQTPSRFREDFAKIEESLSKQTRMLRDLFLEYPEVSSLKLYRTYINYSLQGKYLLSRQDFTIIRKKYLETHQVSQCNDD